jgi:hypothetical protein
MSDIERRIRALEDTVESLLSELADDDEPGALEMLHRAFVLRVKARKDDRG